MLMGKVSINTLEGWNQRAAIANRNAFIDKFGRKPENKEEVTSWVNGLLAECGPIDPRPEPEERFEYYDGQAWIVTRF
jgi:hypothetical protein